MKQTTTTVDDYTLKWSKGTGDKKYRVIIYKDNKKQKTIQFGTIGYEQYKDTTPLKLYNAKDHKDKERRDRYMKRHKKIKTKDGKLAYKIKFSPSWFSYKYLWGGE